MKDINILKDNGVDVDKSLELLGDMDMYEEVAHEFLSMIDNKISLLEKYKSINDMKNYSIEVHSLKSDVRYLGFYQTGDLAFELEQKSKANDISGVYEKHGLLISKVHNIIKILNSYMTGEELNLESIKESNNNVESVNYLDPMSQAIVYQSQGHIKEDKPTSEEKEGVILIVDDSQIVSNFVKKVFEHKYEVAIANNGEEAIKLCDDDEFRLKIKTCILDINMPVINGFDVLEHFKNNNYFVKLPVVVISGLENPEVLAKAKSYPIIDVLEKPFNERDVIECVNKCLAAYF